MIISRTSEYALRAVSFLAEHAGNTRFDARRISRSTSVPQAYVSKVFQTLTRAGLVESKPGPGGGFILRRPASEISLMDVIEAVDDVRRLPLYGCLMGLRHCDGRSPCPLHPIWSHTTVELADKLRHTTVSAFAMLNSRFRKRRSTARRLTRRMRSIFR